MKDDKISGIYKIINKVNDMYYIGSSKNIDGCKGRFATHKSLLKHGKHPNIYLQRAWTKYSEDCFIFEVLELVGQSDLLKREQYFLDTAKANNHEIYNLSMIAGRVEHTIEVRKKMSDANRIRKISSETKNKIRLARLGSKMSDETKEKISLASKGENNGFYGKQHSEQTKQKIRKFRIDSNASCASNNPSYDHTIYNFYNTKTQETFIGTRYELYTKYNLSRSKISLVVSGTRKHHRNWIIK